MLHTTVLLAEALLPLVGISALIILVRHLLRSGIDTLFVAMVSAPFGYPFMTLGATGMYELGLFHTKSAATLTALVTMIVTIAVWYVLWKKYPHLLP